MLRYVSALAVIFTVSRSTALAEAFSEADIIGTWRVDPSTFDVIDYSETRPRSDFTGKILVINADGIFEETYAAGRRVVGPQMPTNYANFALIFEKGGSFMATNIPAGLFFDWAAMSELSGKWSLQAAVAVSLKMGRNFLETTSFRIFNCPLPEFTMWMDARVRLVFHYGKSTAKTSAISFAAAFAAPGCR
jgi:hypothetical protein